MKKKLQKGFTLVELLVVIAILAVLATVSVVGYTSFIAKANNSNALTELKQCEDIILSDLIATGKEKDAVKRIPSDAATDAAADVVFKYSIGTGKVEIIVNKTTPLTRDQMKEVSVDLDQINGEFFAVDGYNGNDCIVYRTANNKGYAYWGSTKDPATLPDSPTIGDIAKNDADHLNTYFDALSD